MPVIPTQPVDVKLYEDFLKLQYQWSSTAAGPAAAPSTPTPGAPPVASSTALAPWLRALGYVSDGDIIQAPMWNNLVTSIMLLATALDVQPPQQDETVSAWPGLLASGDASSLGGGETEVPFVQELRGATGLKGATTTQVFCGWMPLELPDGFNIVALKVHGARPDPMSRWNVSVLRQALGQTAFDTVITSDIATVSRTADGSFTTDQIPVTPGGHTADQLAKLTLVDNHSYRYAFNTQARTASSPEAIELRLVQVICSRA